MKQAILITAYKDFDQLINLVDFFDDSFNIYIHIDQKSIVEAHILESLKRDNVIVVEQQYTIYWGGINHLKAYLKLAELALEDLDNHYFHLISGQDYPVKSLRFFKNWLQKEALTQHNYLDFFEIDKYWGGYGFERLKYFHFYDLLDAKKHKTIIRKLVKLQKSLGFNRSYSNDFPKLYGGSTYWSLSRTALDFVMSFTKSNPIFLRRFRYTFCAEEMYFQTILVNSSFFSTIKSSNLRYILWSKERGYPAVLNETDYDDIKSGSFLFARKFSNESANLLNLLKKDILA